MGARENEGQISQNYILHVKFSEFYLGPINGNNLALLAPPNLYNKYLRDKTFLETKCLWNAAT